MVFVPCEVLTGLYPLGHSNKFLFGGFSSSNAGGRVIIKVQEVHFEVPAAPMPDKAVHHARPSVVRASLAV